jgi:hypothetical protein
MLYRKIIAVCSQIHTKHTNTLCGQNVALMNVKLAVHIVTTGPYTVEYHPSNSCGILQVSLVVALLLVIGHVQSEPPSHGGKCSKFENIIKMNLKRIAYWD